MSSKDIKNYVINCLKKGFTKQAILIVTQNAGWSEEDIDQVFDDEEVKALLSKIEKTRKKEEESKQEKAKKSENDIEAKKEEVEEETTEKEIETKVGKDDSKDKDEESTEKDIKENEESEDIELDIPPSPIPESSDTEEIEESKKDKEKNKDEVEQIFDEPPVPLKDSKKKSVKEEESEQKEDEEKKEDIKDEIDSELKSYVLDHLNEGFRVKVVKIGAVDNGWSEEDIDKVFEDEEIKSLLLKKKGEEELEQEDDEEKEREDETKKEESKKEDNNEEIKEEDPLSFLTDDDENDEKKGDVSLPVKKSPKNKTRPSSEDTTNKTSEEIALMEKDKSEKKEAQDEVEQDEERVKEIKKNLEIKDDETELKDSEFKKETLKKETEETSDLKTQDKDKEEKDINTNETLNAENNKSEFNEKSNVNEKLEKNIKKDKEDNSVDEVNSKNLEDFSKEDSLNEEIDKKRIDNLTQEKELGFKESEILNEDEDSTDQEIEEVGEDSKKDGLSLEENKQGEDFDKVENNKKKESLLEKENVIEEEDEESVFYSALRKYVVEHLKAGFDEHEIKEEVINAGWPGGEVSKVFKEEEVVKLLSLVEKQSKESPSFKENKSSNFQQPEIFEVNRKESDNYQNNNNLNQDTNKKDSQLDVADFEQQPQDSVFNQNKQNTSNEVTDNFNPALKSYVVTRLKKGFDKEIVSFGANNAGWSNEEIEKVFEDEDVQLLLSNKEKKENTIQNNYSDQSDANSNTQKDDFNENFDQTSQSISDSTSVSNVSGSISDDNEKIKEEGLNKDQEKVREPNPLLKSYILDNLKRGFDPESIKKTALEAGWPEENVNRVLTSSDAEEVIFKKIKPEEDISSNDNLVKTRPSSDATTPVQPNDESQFVEPGTVGKQSVESSSQPQPSSYPQQSEQFQTQSPLNSPEEQSVEQSTEQPPENTTTPSVKTRPSSDATTPVQPNEESQFVEPGTVGKQSVESSSQPQPSSYPQQSEQFQTQSPTSSSEESVEQFNEQSLESTTTPGVKTRPSSDATPVQSNEDNDFVQPGMVGKQSVESSSQPQPSSYPQQLEQFQTQSPLNSPEEQSVEQSTEQPPENTTTPSVKTRPSSDTVPVSEEKIPKKSRVNLADIPDYSTLQSKQVSTKDSNSKLENNKDENNKESSASRVKKLEFINGKAKRSISNPASFFIEESYSSSEFEDVKQGKVKDKEKKITKEENEELKPLNVKSGEITKEELIEDKEPESILEAVIKKEKKEQATKDKHKTLKEVVSEKADSSNSFNQKNEIEKENKEQQVSPAPEAPNKE